MWWRGVIFAPLTEPFLSIIQLQIALLKALLNAPLTEPFLSIFQLQIQQISLLKALLNDSRRVIYCSPVIFKQQVLD